MTSTSASVDPVTVAARWLGLAGLLVALGTLLLWLSAARPVLTSPAPPPWGLVIAGSLIGGAAARPIAAALGDDAAGLPFDEPRSARCRAGLLGSRPRSVSRTRR